MTGCCDGGRNRLRRVGGAEEHRGVHRRGGFRGFPRRWFGRSPSQSPLPRQFDRRGTARCRRRGDSCRHLPLRSRGCRVIQPVLAAPLGRVVLCADRGCTVGHATLLEPSQRSWTRKPCSRSTSPSTLRWHRDTSLSRHSKRQRDARAQRTSSSTAFGCSARRRR